MTDVPPPKEALKPLTESSSTPIARKRLNPIVFTLILAPLISTLAFFFLPISSLPSTSSSSLKINLPRHIAFPGSEDVLPLRQQPFNPEEYEHKYGKVAKAKGKDRSGWFGEKEVELDLHYLDINPTSSNVLVFVHGWPAVWSSWRSQILEFQDTHRLIVPTLRGYGNSTAPRDPEHSTTVQDIGDDLEAILTDAGIVNSVTCVGHDWGAHICWSAALDRPTRYHAVANAAVPYFPPTPSFAHPSESAKKIPTLGYQTYFSDNRHLAVKELDADPAGAVKCVLLDKNARLPDGAFSSKGFLLKAWNGKIPDQNLISKQEESYWVKAFKASGFESTLALYAIGNRKRSHANASKRKSHIFPQPALFFAPSKDILGPMDQIMKPMQALVPNLKIVHVESSHWPQLEEPEQYNAELRTFLESL